MCDPFQYQSSSKWPSGPYWFLRVRYDVLGGQGACLTHGFTVDMVLLLDG